MYRDVQTIAFHIPKHTHTHTHIYVYMFSEIVTGILEEF